MMATNVTDVVRVVESIPLKKKTLALKELQIRETIEVIQTTVELRTAIKLNRLQNITETY